MFEMKVIEPAELECTAGIEIASTKYSPLSFFVVCRKINVVTERHSYRTFRTEECMDSLEDVLMFANLDAKCCYCKERTEHADFNET